MAGELSYEQMTGAAAPAPTPAPQPQAHGGDPYAAAGWRPIHAPNGAVVGFLPPVGQVAQDGGVLPAQSPAAPAAPATSADTQPNAKRSNSGVIPAGGTGAQGPIAFQPLPAAPAEGELSYEDMAKAAPPGPDTRPTSEGLGFVEGLTKPLDNAAGWLNKILPDDAVAHALGMKSTREAIADRQAAQAEAEKTQRPGELGKIGGEIAGTLPLALIPGGAATGMASKLPMIGSVAARLAPTAATLAEGAGAGALLTDNPDSAAQVGQDALTGAIGGYVGGKVLGALGNAATPVLKPAVQRLIDAGVPLTPGQISGGAVKRVEDALQSWPVLGDAIKSAQRRSMEGFNTAAANEALSHIGETVPRNVKAGRDTIAHVESRLSDAYDQIKPQLSADLDTPFIQGMANIRQSIAPEALDALPTFDRVLKDEVLRRVAASPTGMLDGQAAKDAQTAIGQEIAGMAPSPDPKTRAVVKGLRSLQDELSASLMRNSSPGAASRLSDINAGYARYARLRDASASASEKEGGLFTPYKLSQAAKKGDKSVGKGSFAKGGALMQDLASAGEQVLPSTVPDSGTAMRLLVSELPMLVGFGAESQHYFPQLAGTMIAGGVAGLPYTGLGQRLTQKALTRRPWTQSQSQAVIDAMRPYIVDAGAVGGQRTGAKTLPQLPAR